MSADIKATLIAAALSGEPFLTCNVGRDELTAAVAHIEALEKSLAESKAAHISLAKMMGDVIHDMTVANQAAWIAWRREGSAEEGMRWIENGLCGPGHIPDEDEPYSGESQAYWDANQSNPLPQCACGRPSNIMWMGQGFCCSAHYEVAKAKMPFAAQ